MDTIFLISPASTGGKRAAQVLNPDANFEIARRLRESNGVAIGELFSFLSALYFRGKLTYARHFGSAPPGISAVHIITANRGLVPPDQLMTLEDIRELQQHRIDTREKNYVRALEQSCIRLRSALGPASRVVLLGSIATGKYTDILQGVFEAKLLFPTDFVGRGDMSRGGLLLRAARSNEELSYSCITEASLRRGKRPSRLPQNSGDSGITRA